MCTCSLVSVQPEWVRAFCYRREKSKLYFNSQTFRFLADTKLHVHVVYKQKSQHCIWRQQQFQITQQKNNRNAFCFGRPDIYPDSNPVIGKLNDKFIYFSFFESAQLMRKEAKNRSFNAFVPFNIQARICSRNELLFSKMVKIQFISSDF